MTSVISYLKQKWHLLILFFIWFFSTILQFIWLTLDKMPPWGDGISPVLEGMRLFQEQSLNGWEGLIRSLFQVPVYSFSPPIIAATYFLYYKIFGLSSEMEIMVNSLYLALGVIGVYGIGKYLFDKYTGLFSALIFTSLPGVIMFAKLGFKEFNMMCFIALTIYLLLKSNGFKDRRFSILFAISFAATLLIKLESMIFIIFPLAFIGVRVFLDRNFFKDRYRVITMILVPVIVFSISSWYAVNFFSFMQSLSERVGTNAGMHSVYFSTKNLGFYSYILYNELLTKFQIGFFIAIFTYMLVRILSLKIKAPELRRNIFLVICFIFPFLVFTFLCEKTMAHLLSLLLFASLIMAGGCSIIRNKIVKYIIICVVVLHCINIQLGPLFALDCDMKNPPYLVKVSPVDNIFYKLRERFPSLYGDELRITLEAWSSQLRAILEFIDKNYNPVDSDNSRKKPSVLLLSNFEPFRFFQMEYYNMKIGLPVSLTFFISGFQFFKEAILSGKYDYIITEEPLYLQDPDHEEPRQLKMIYSFIEENQDEFDKKYKIVKKIDLPRQSSAVIYKRINLESKQ